MTSAIETDQSGIVYVLTNPAMPGLVKIGKTSRNSLDQRLQELYGTGVPVPFECAFAAKVSDETSWEKALHTAFGPQRINPKREFFGIEPEQAIALLKLIALEDVTPATQQVAENVDAESRAAGERLKSSRRPNFNFVEMGIPVGADLQFTQSDVTVIVVDERRVKRPDDPEPRFLSAITRELLNSDGAPATLQYWTYNGRRLREIYDETYAI